MQLKVAFRTLMTFGGFLALTLSLSTIALAQSGYEVSQGASNVSDTGGNSGPVRMGRIAYTQGKISWRTSDQADWSNATTNLPLRQGASVWVNNGGRAEIQFDDGSRLRLGNGTIVTLETMYSDDKGELTELKLNTGLASFTLVSKLSQYQIDTPLTSIKAVGPAQIRIGISKGIEVAVRKGTVQFEGSQGTTTLNTGDYATLNNNSDPIRVASLPAADNWDQFNDNRDASYNQPDAYLPRSVAIMSGNLNNYGSWRSNARYGHIWHPRGISANWRPYHDGHWTWVDPFGWTWVGGEEWGWAPYHYGSWIHDDGGWGWAPGPSQQYWSPAVVSFSVYNGSVAWVPLAPFEMHYPSSIGFGFQSGNWSLSFAIGGAASYYPGGQGYVVGRPWMNGYVNRSTNIYNATTINNYYSGRNISANNRFQPAYGRNAFAISRTTSAGFNGAGRYQMGTSADTAAFQKGRSFGAGRGAPNVFGPSGVRPNRMSFTPSRSFGASRPPTQILSRPIVRSPLPGMAARFSRPIGGSIAPGMRAASIVRAVRPANTGARPTRGNMNQANQTRPGMARTNTRPGAANQRAARPTNNRAAPAGTRPGMATSNARPGTANQRAARPTNNRAAPAGTRPGMARSNSRPGTANQKAARPANNRATPPKAQTNRAANAARNSKGARPAQPRTTKSSGAKTQRPAPARARSTQATTRSTAPKKGSQTTKQRQQPQRQQQQRQQPQRQQQQRQQPQRQQQQRQQPQRQQQQRQQPARNNNPPQKKRGGG